MIKKKKASKRIEVDLTGPDGNAFVLLGLASRWARQLGMDRDKILADMTSGNYENLVAVLDREFGDIVTLYR